MSNAQPSAPVTAAAARGAVGGMIAGAAMAMVAMVASVTYQHHGFFTPLFHISALLGSPDAMMTSVAKAMAGQRFWFSFGPALLGMVIHMMTGAMFGVAYAFVALRIPKSLTLVSGMVYGVVVFAVAAFVGLPIAGKVTDTGSVISDMPKMVGWATFVFEHLVFGMTLALVLAFAATPRRATAARDAHAAALAR